MASTNPVEQSLAIRATTGRHHTPIPFVDDYDAQKKRRIRIRDIKRHPKYLDYYQELLDPGLVASIEENGLIEPVILNLDLVMIIGWRRLLVYDHLGHDEIDAYVRAFDPALEEEALLDSNLQRDPSKEERVRVFAGYYRIEREKAARRMLAGGHPPRNSPEGEEYGEARKIAGKKAKIDGETARNALRVLEECDRRRDGPEKDAVKSVLAAINKSYNGGIRRAWTLGWDVSTPKGISKKAPTPVVVHATIQAEAVEEGWIDSVMIEEAVKQLPLDEAIALSTKNILTAIAPSLISTEKYHTAPNNKAYGSYEKSTAPLILHQDINSIAGIQKEIPNSDIIILNQEQFQLPLDLLKTLDTSNKIIVVEVVDDSFPPSYLSDLVKLRGNKDTRNKPLPYPVVKNGGQSHFKFVKADGKSIVFANVWTIRPPQFFPPEEEKDFMNTSLIPAIQTAQAEANDPSKKTAQ